MVIDVGPSLRDGKATLRQANANAASDIARLTGLGHAAVNGELNRRSGVTRIGAAAVEQLQTRLAAAHRWLDRIGTKT
jgi:hypothetical protein